MKKFLLFSVLFYCSCAFAQISFDKGYFIDNSGNRTECFIKNMDWRLNPTEFIYKTTAEDSETKNESIATVDEFGIDNVSKYKRFSILMERSGTNINNLVKSKDPVFKRETLFLKVLVEGDAILYNYSEANLTKFFHQTKNVPAEQLICIQYMGSEKNDGVDTFGESVRINKAFRRQLYANERCEKISDAEFENLEYKESMLVKHFKKFNSCGTNAAITYEVKDRPKPFNIKVVAGLSHAKVDIKDQNIYYNRSTDLSQTSFKFGVEAEWVLPFNKNKWSISINPMYQKFHAEKTYVRGDNNPVWPTDIEHHVHVEYSSIELGLGLRHYLFLGKNSRLFFEVGYVYDVMGKAKINFDDSMEFESTTGGNAMFGVGYSFMKKISVEVRAFTDRELMGDYLNWSTTYNAPGIVFAYRIF